MLAPGAAPSVTRIERIGSAAACSSSTTPSTRHLVHGGGGYGAGATVIVGRELGAYRLGVDQGDGEA